jgi:HPt (histidine-containing phosphotransfer) domain-containing protein
MAQIDWKQFNENFQYYDKEIIKEVIDIFVEEYDERISTLNKNIEENDLVNLAFNAHSLKSVISNYMAPYVLELTRSLEDMAKKNQEENIPETFQKLKMVSKELLDELIEYLKVSKIR